MVKADIPRAEVAEIFSSIQGEGMFVGAKQIFVRFKKCNLSCLYCDEAKDTLPAEYTPLELLAKLQELDRPKGSHHSVSLTGGEPLLYADFLTVFLRLLKSAGYKSYLETNGILSKELLKVVDLTDIVAMDFKLPSSTGEAEFWNEHLEFLGIAARQKVFVKAVITPETTKEDVEKAMMLIRKVDRNIPFILQPATPVKDGDRMIGRERLLEFLEMASENELGNARIIPQIHKILSVK
jgi:organic radical activating enzyme